MSISSVKRHLTNTAGSNLIEFSFAMLVLIPLMLGFLDLCRLVLVYNTIGNAARVGARYAISHGADRIGSGTNGPSDSNDYSQVLNVVNGYLRSMDFKTASDAHSPCPANGADPAGACVQVDYPDTLNTVGSRVRVKVYYRYNALTTLLSTGWNIGSVSEGVISF